MYNKPVGVIMYSTLMKLCNNVYITNNITNFCRVLSRQNTRFWWDSEALEPGSGETGSLRIRLASS